LDPVFSGKLLIACATVEQVTLHRVLDAIYRSGDEGREVSV